MARKNRKLPPKKPVREKIVEAFDMPKELLLGMPKLIFTGNREVYIENYMGIIEYGDEVIRLNTKQKMIKLSGQFLEIKNIAEEEITVIGEIKGVEFL